MLTVHSAQPPRGDTPHSPASLELFAYRHWEGMDACHTIATASASYIFTCVGGLPLAVGGGVGVVSVDGAVAARMAQAAVDPSAAPPAAADGMAGSAAAARMRAAVAASVEDAVYLIRVDAFGHAVGVGHVGHMAGVGGGVDATPVLWTCGADDDTSGRGSGPGVWTVAVGSRNDRLGGDHTVAIAHIRVPMEGGADGRASEPSTPGGRHGRARAEADFEANMADIAVGGLGRVFGLACGRGDGLVVQYETLHGAARAVRCHVEGIDGMVCEDDGGHSGNDAVDSAHRQGHGDSSDGALAVPQAGPETNPAEAVAGAARRLALSQQVRTPWGDVFRLAADVNAAGDSCVWMAIAGARTQQLGAVAPYMPLGSGTSQLLVAHVCPFLSTPTFSGVFEIDFNGRAVDYHRDVMQLKVTRMRDVWVAGNAFSPITYRASARQHRLTMDDIPCVYAFRLAPITAEVQAHRIICAKRITANGVRGVNVSAIANHGTNGLLLALNPSTPTFSIDGFSYNGWMLNQMRTNYTVLVALDEDARAIALRGIVVAPLSPTLYLLPSFVVTSIAERAVDETGVGQFSGYHYAATAQSHYGIGIHTMKFDGGHLVNVPAIRYAFISFRADLRVITFSNIISTGRIDVAEVVPLATGGWAVCGNATGTLTITGIPAASLTAGTLTTDEIVVFYDRAFVPQAATRIRPTTSSRHSGVGGCAPTGDGGVVTAGHMPSNHLFNSVTVSLPSGVTTAAYYRRYTASLAHAELTPLSVADAGAEAAARAVAVLADGRVVVGGRFTHAGAVNLVGDSGAYRHLALMAPSPSSVGMVTTPRHAAGVLRAIHPARASVLLISRDSVGGYWAAISASSLTNAIAPITVTSYTRQLIVMRFAETHDAVAAAVLQWPADPMPNSGSGGAVWGLASDGFGGVWVGGTRSGATAWTCGPSSLPAVAGATDAFVFRLTQQATFAFCKAVATAGDDTLHGIVPLSSGRAVVLLGTTAATIAFAATGPTAASTGGGVAAAVLLVTNADGSFHSQQVITAAANSVRLLGGAADCDKDSITAPVLRVALVTTGAGTITSSPASAAVTSTGAIALAVFRTYTLTPVSITRLTTGTMAAADTLPAARVARGAEAGSLLICALVQGRIQSAAAPLAGTAGVHNVVVMKVRGGTVMWHVTIEAVYTGGTLSANASADCDEDGTGGAWVVYTFDRAHTVRGAVATTTYTASPTATGSVLAYVDSKGRIAYHHAYTPTPDGPSPHSLRMRTVRALPSCTLVIGGWLQAATVAYPEARRVAIPWAPTAPEHGLLMAMGTATCVPPAATGDVCEVARTVATAMLPGWVVYEVQTDVTDYFWIRVTPLVPGSYYLNKQVVAAYIIVARHARDGSLIYVARLGTACNFKYNSSWAVDGIGGVWLALSVPDILPSCPYQWNGYIHHSAPRTFALNFDGWGASTGFDHLMSAADTFMSSIGTYMNKGFLASLHATDRFLITGSMPGFSTWFYLPRGATYGDQLREVRTIRLQSPRGSLGPRFFAYGLLGGGPAVHSFTHSGNTFTSVANEVSIIGFTMGADLQPTRWFTIGRSSAWTNIAEPSGTYDGVLFPFWTHGKLTTGSGAVYAAVTTGRSLTARLDVNTGTVTVPMDYTSGTSFVNITSTATDSMGRGHWISGTTMNKRFDLGGHTFGSLAATSVDSRALVYADEDGAPAWRAPFAVLGSASSTTEEVNLTYVSSFPRCGVVASYGLTPTATTQPRLAFGLAPAVTMSASQPTVLAIMDQQAHCGADDVAVHDRGFAVFASRLEPMHLAADVGAASVRIIQLVSDGGRGVWALALANGVTTFHSQTVHLFQRQLIVARFTELTMSVDVALALSRTTDGPFLAQPDDNGGVWLAATITSTAMQFGKGAALAAVGGTDIAIAHYDSLLAVLAVGAITGTGNEVPTAIVPSVSPTSPPGTALAVAFQTDSTSVTIAGTAVSLSGVGAAPTHPNALIVEVHHGRRDDVACSLQYSGTRATIPSAAAGAAKVSAMTTSCATTNLPTNYTIGAWGNLIVAVVAVRAATPTVAANMRGRGTFLVRLDGSLTVRDAAPLFDTPVDTLHVTPDGVGGQWVCTAIYFPLRSAFGAVPAPYAGDDYCVRVDISMTSIADNRANAPVGGLWLKGISGDGEGGVWTLSEYYANVVMPRGATTVPRGWRSSVLTHIGRDGAVLYSTSITSTQTDVRMEAIVMMPMCEILLAGYNSGPYDLAFGPAGRIPTGVSFIGLIREDSCTITAYARRSTAACPLWFPLMTLSASTGVAASVEAVVPIEGAGGFHAFITYQSASTLFGLRISSALSTGTAVIRFDASSLPRRAVTIKSLSLVITGDDMDGMWLFYPYTSAGATNIELGNAVFRATSPCLLGARMNVELEFTWAGLIANGSASALSTTSPALVLCSRRDGSGGVLALMLSPTPTVFGGAYESTRATGSFADAHVLAVNGQGYVQWGTRVHQVGGSLFLGSVIPSRSNGGVFATLHHVSGDLVNSADNSVVTTLKGWGLYLFHETGGVSGMFTVTGYSATGSLAMANTDGFWICSNTSITYFAVGSGITVNVSMRLVFKSILRCDPDGNGGVWTSILHEENKGAWNRRFLLGSRPQSCLYRDSECVSVVHINPSGDVDYADDLSLFARTPETLPFEAFPHRSTISNAVFVPIGGTCGFALLFNSQFSWFTDFGAPNQVSYPDGYRPMTYVASFHTSSDISACSGLHMYQSAVAVRQCSTAAALPPVITVPARVPQLPPPLPALPPPIPFVPVPTTPATSPKAPVAVAATPALAPSPIVPPLWVGGPGRNVRGDVPVPIAPTAPATFPQWPPLLTTRLGLGAMILQAVAEDRLGGLWCLVGAVSATTFLGKAVTSSTNQWIIARVDITFTTAAVAKAVAATASMTVAHVRALVLDGYGGMWVAAGTSGTGTMDMGGGARTLPATTGGLLIARYSYALDHMASKVVPLGAADGVTGAASYGSGGVVLTAKATGTLAAPGGDCTVPSTSVGTSWVVVAFDHAATCRRLRLLKGTVHGILADATPAAAGAPDEYLLLVGYPAAVTDDFGVPLGIAGPSATHMLRLFDAPGFPLLSAGVVTRMPPATTGVVMALDGVGGVWFAFFHTTAVVQLRDRSEELPQSKSLLLLRVDAKSFELRAVMYAGITTSCTLRALLGDGLGGVWLVGEATGAVAVTPSRLSLPAVAARRPVVLHAASYRIFDSSYVATTAGSGSAWGTVAFASSPVTFVERGCRLGFGVQSDAALSLQYPKPVGHTTAAAGASVIELEIDVNACKDTSFPRNAVGNIVPTDYIAMSALSTIALKGTDNGGWIVAVVAEATTAVFLGTTYPSGGSGREMLVTTFDPTGMPMCTFLLGYAGGTTATFGTFGVLAPRRDGRFWVGVHAAPTSGTARAGNIRALATRTTVAGGKSVLLCISETCTAVLHMATGASLTAAATGPEDTLLAACHATSATTVGTEAIAAGTMAVVDIDDTGAVLRATKFTAADPRLVTSMFADCATMSLFMGGMSGSAHSTTLAGVVGTIALRASGVYVMRFSLEDFLSVSVWVSVFNGLDAQIAPRGGGLWLSTIVSGSATHAGTTYAAIGTRDVLMISLTFALADVGAVRVGGAGVTVSALKGTEEEVEGGVIVAAMTSGTAPSAISDSTTTKRAFATQGGALVFLVMDAAAPYVEHVVPMRTSGSFTAAFAASSLCRVICAGSINRAPTSGHPAGSLPVVRVGHSIRQDMAASDSAFVVRMRTRDALCQMPQYRAAACALRVPPAPNGCPASLVMSVDAGALVDPKELPPSAAWVHGGIVTGKRFTSHRCKGTPMYSEPPSTTFPPDGKSTYLKARDTTAGAEWCTAVGGFQDIVAVGQKGLVDVYYVHPVTRTVGLETRLRGVVDVSTSTTMSFGTTLALRGDVLVVGAPGDMTALTHDLSGGNPAPQTNVGSAIVYERTAVSGPSLFTEVATLRHPHHARLEMFFGAAVDVSSDGRVIVVGAPGDLYGYTTDDGVVVTPYPTATDVLNSGSIAVFVRGFDGIPLGGGVWYSAGLVREALATRAASRRFGSAVAVDGTWPTYVVIGSAPSVGYVQVNAVTMGAFMRPMALATGTSMGVVAAPAPFTVAQRTGFGTSIGIACVTTSKCHMMIGTPQDNHCGVSIIPAGTSYLGGCTARGGVWVTSVDVGTGNIAYEALIKPPAAVQSGFGSSVGLRCVGLSICRIVVGAPTDELSGTGRITAYSAGTVRSGAAYIVTRTEGVPPTYSWVRALRPWHQDDIAVGTRFGASVDAIETSSGAYRAVVCAPGAGNAAYGVNQEVYLDGAANSGALFIENYP